MTERGNKILVVEDDPESAFIFRKFFTAQGFDVVVASNGEEAILKAGPDGPDLVIMDVMMPVLDGLEACRYFKAKYKQKCLPVMFVTAREDTTSMEKGIEMGGDDYYTKPVDWQGMKVAVSALLELSGLQKQIGDGEPGAEPDPKVMARVNETFLGLAESAERRGVLPFARKNFEAVLDNDKSNRRANEGLARVMAGVEL